MPRRRNFIDANVHDEARARMHHIYDIHDDVCVNFSGGKDSTVVLEMTRQIAQERGIDHVNVVFRDEELIPSTVIDFVNHYREQPWVRMQYFCVPLASNKFVMGNTANYVQWDPNRRWLRPKPPWAITLADLGLPEDTVMDQYTMGEVQAAPYKGKVAFLTGMRAAESLYRYSGMMAKLNENYICGDTKRSTRCHPIFDWQENDVFRFFYDFDIRYCDIYDAQIWSKTPLRVATPLHSEAAKRFGNWRAIDPVFYSQIVDLFPDMKVQERYWNEKGEADDLDQYGGSYDDVQRWIEDHLDEPIQRAKALKELASVRRKALARPAGYPPRYVLGKMMGGGFKRAIMPMRDVDSKALKETA